MAATSPLLNQNGYCVPPQQGGYYPSGYGPPQAYRPDAAPWYHPNIPSNHYFAPTGMPAPLFPHWQPPMRGRGSRPWRGGKGRGRWSGGSTVLLECKPCSKQYKSREAYDTHIQSHVKCITCDFKGAGKALKDHQLMHMLPDELKFTSHEDILKWREERKRKYPTAENVEKKERLAADKSDRGESAITPLHRYIQHLVGDDRYSRGRKGGRGRGRGGRGRPSDRRDSHKQSFTPKQDSTNERQTHQEDASQAQQNIVGAILADCESQSAEHEVVNSPSPKKQRLEGPQSEKRASRRPKKRVKAATTGLRCVSYGRKPTLLEKLLAPEIRHEENALLQCIRHITTNNFFTGQEPSISGTSS